MQGLCQVEGDGVVNLWEHGLPAIRLDSVCSRSRRPYRWQAMLPQDCIQLMSAALVRVAPLQGESAQ